MWVVNIVESFYSDVGAEVFFKKLCIWACFFLHLYLFFLQLLFQFSWAVWLTRKYFILNYDPQNLWSPNKWWRDTLFLSWTHKFPPPSVAYDTRTNNSLNRWHQTCEHLEGSISWDSFQGENWTIKWFASMCWVYNRVWIWYLQVKITDIIHLPSVWHWSQNIGSIFEGQVQK